MNLKRLARHLLATPLAARRAYPRATLAAIGEALAQAEKRHAGQVRFALEAALDIGPLLAGQSARERAIDVFSLARIWDTEHNNGVLIYLLLADRDVEIVADRGISARVAQPEWERICHSMEARLARGEYLPAALVAIEATAALLAAHFPPGSGAKNELPDEPLVL